MNKLIVFGIFVLTLITAAIHIYAGTFGSILLILNGIGYLGLFGLAFLPFTQKYHRLARIGLIIYTFITIVAYMATHLHHLDKWGVGTKAVEVCLIALLVLSLRNLSTSKSLF